MSGASAAPAAYLQIVDVVKDFGGVPAPSTTSPWTSPRARSSRCSARRAAARRRCCACWPASRRRPSGRIVLDGQDLAGLPPYERPINMMFQSYALFPHLTVWDNIAFGLRREGLPRDAGRRARRRDAQAGAARARSPSASRTSCRAASSSAWRWRAAWPSSRSCCCSTSRWARSTRSCARRRRSSWSTSSSEVGVTCVMVTHDQEEAMTMASRIAVMSEGRVLQVGAPREIYEIAGHPLRRRLHRQRQPDRRHAGRGRGRPRASSTAPTAAIYVGHGITGTRGHAGDGGDAAREDPPRAVASRAGADRTTACAAPSRICATSAASRSTTCELASGAVAEGQPKSTPSAMRDDRLHAGATASGPAGAAAPQWC